jgi:hypothetical protein
MKYPFGVSNRAESGMNPLLRLLFPNQDLSPQLYLLFHWRFLQLYVNMLTWYAYIAVMKQK